LSTNIEQKIETNVEFVVFTLPGDVKPRHIPIVIRELIIQMYTEIGVFHSCMELQVRVHKWPRHVQFLIRTHIRPLTVMHGVTAQHSDAWGYCHRLYHGICGIFGNIAILPNFA